MTDLTEQWKKGELPSGWYYYGIHNETDVIGCDKLKMYRNRRDIKDDIEVLAPVPSYEEWQARLEENAQLKELLKKANKFLKDYGFTFDGKDCAEAFKVHTKINKVLK